MFANPAANAQAEADDAEIVVRSRRDTGDIAPLRHFDEQAIRAIGARSIADLVARLGSQVKGVDGSPPVFVLNGRRPLNDEEIYTLPNDALQAFDILPPEAGAQLGYGTAQPVINLVTKPRFETAELQAEGQTTTDGGGGTTGGKLTFTRLRGKDRVTLSAQMSMQDELRQSQRTLASDPSIPYDVIGNIGGVSAGEIDPALSILAGSLVNEAAVPMLPSSRYALASYADTANRPRTSDLGDYRSLQPRQRNWKLSSFVSHTLGERITSLFSLSFEEQHSWSLQGLATSSVMIPASNGYSPFSNDVVLNRYLLEAGALKQQNFTRTVRAGAGFTGSLGTWNWMLRLNYERVHSRVDSDLGMDGSGLDAATANGLDPFSPFPRSLLGPVLQDHSRTTINSGEGQVILSGVPLYLPAGAVTVTATASAQIAETTGSSASITDTASKLSRNTGGGALTAVIPIASQGTSDLPIPGRLSANVSLGVNGVSRYGTLYNSQYGLTWAPIKRIELLASIRASQSPPTLQQLASPRVETPNTPFFDLVTGQSLFVTSITGGNPDLRPERRRTFALTANVQPFRTDAIRTYLAFETTTVRNQAGLLMSITPAIEDAFPGNFVRNSSGQLILVDWRAVNFARENQKIVKAGASYSGMIGAKAVAGEPVRPATVLNIGVNSTLRLSNRVLLRQGLPELDLLAGDNLSSTGGRPRWDVDGYISAYRQGFSVFLQTMWHSQSRSRSDVRSSNLRFFSLGKTNLTASVSLDQVLKNGSWAKKLTVDATIQNVLNSRQRVRDVAGETPNSYQPAYLDPLGRVVSLRIIKRF